MGTESKENSLVEKPVSSPLASVASEGNSQGESALLRLGELAEEFEAEQVAADARSVAERVTTTLALGRDSRLSSEAS